MIQTTQLLVKKILERSLDGSGGWSLQGLGMLRMYLSEEVRLHIWDSRYAVPNVSRLHDHPWSFQSYVVAGQLANQRYSERSQSLVSHTKSVFCVQQLKCGPGGGLIGEPSVLALFPEPIEVMQAGCAYRQAASEIHDTIPEDGTVTIITRTFPLGRDREHARVFWPYGTEWVSAEPRRATPEVVEDIVSYSLQRWFR